MQHTLIKSITTFMLLCVAPWVHAFTVFTCEPEWASLTRALLPSAQVFSATTHRQDPHHIEARPALIAQLRSADLAVCTGATLEAGWLPTLQQRASNPRIRDGQPGMFYAADQVELIDPYQGTITPFSGDVHRAGNPHLHADPHRVLRVAQALHERLARLLPEEAAAIQTRWRQFDSDWRARLVTWEQTNLSLCGFGNDHNRGAGPDLAVRCHQIYIEFATCHYFRSFWMRSYAFITSSMPPQLKNACSGTWSRSPLAIIEKPSMVSFSGTVEPLTPVNFSAM